MLFEPVLPLEDGNAKLGTLGVGLSVAVSAPLGEYFPDRLVNLGKNRWSFVPRILGRGIIRLRMGRLLDDRRRCGERSREHCTWGGKKQLPAEPDGNARYRIVLKNDF